MATVSFHLVASEPTAAPGWASWRGPVPPIVAIVKCATTARAMHLRLSLPREMLAL